MCVLLPCPCSPLARPKPTYPPPPLLLMAAFIEYDPFCVPRPADVPVASAVIASNGSVVEAATFVVAIAVIAPLLLLLLLLLLPTSLAHTDSLLSVYEVCASGASPPLFLLLRRPCHWGVVAFAL